MPNDLDQYEVGAADWRKTLRQNSHRTYMIIIIFFLIYCAVGFLVDTAYYSGEYPQANLSQLFLALLTFTLVPYATIIMLLIAGFSLFVTFLFYDKLMLLGTDYHEIT